MGLDMYLSKVDNQMLAYKDTSIWNLKDENPKLYNKLKPHLIRSKYGYDELTEEVGYWRKANHIHLWFVHNVQDDSDDCKSYIVTKEKIEELLDTCRKVKSSIKLVTGMIKNGYHSNSSGEMVANMEQGKYIENTEIAEELLPTCAGFFFGGVDYDQWYAEDIDDTIHILEKVLVGTDFNTHSILYTSSW